MATTDAQQQPETIQFASLNKLLELENVEKVCHDVLDSVVQRGPGNQQQYSFEVEKLVNVWKAYVAHVLSLGLQAEQIRQELEALGLQKKGAELLVYVLEGRRKELDRAMKQSVTELSACHLKDFDWKIQYLVASDKCSFIQEPRLLLNLYLSPTKEVLLELSLSELEMVLADFAKIQQVIQKVTF